MQFIPIPTVPLAFFLPFALLAAGCGKKEAAAPAVPVVQVAKPVVKGVSRSSEFTTRIEAFESVDIRAKVSGYLTEIKFKDGQKVNVGDVLFVIDPRPFQAEMDKATGNLEKIESELKLAATNAERAEKLLKDQVVSKLEYDQIMTKFGEAKAGKASAEAAVEAARLNVEYSRVTAPLAGTVGKTAISAGNLIEAGKDVLTTIVSSDKVYASFDVDERSLVEARRRRVELDKAGAATSNAVTVALALSDEKVFTHRGEIDFIDNQVNTATGTIRVRGVFPNPDGLLTPGLFARVRLASTVERDALLIPEKAIGTDQGEKFVYVVNAQDTVEFRKVKVGALEDGLRIITEGLQPEDRVITEGLLRVRPGAPVKVAAEAAGGNK